MPMFHVESVSQPARTTYHVSPYSRRQNSKPKGTCWIVSKSNNQLEKAFRAVEAVQVVEAVRAAQHEDVGIYPTTPSIDVVSSSQPSVYYVTL